MVIDFSVPAATLSNLRAAADAGVAYVTGTTGFDAELVETDHSAKRDAPSGTALHLARAVAEGRGIALEEHLVLERAGDIGARPEAPSASKPCAAATAQAST